VREFGADVNAEDHYEETPLHWVSHARHAHRAPAFDALVALGADLEARDHVLATPVFEAAYRSSALVQRFLSAGAEVNVRAMYHMTPLMYACHPNSRTAPDALSALLRASAIRTRRAVSNDGQSALDLLLASGTPPEAWKREAAAELLSSGAPVQPQNASHVLSIAARLAERRWAEAAAHADDPPTWQVHEAMVGLALDMREVREVDEVVRVKEARVAELEEELRARGGEESEGGSEGGGSGGGSGGR
jgi:hypothetical protein